MSTSKGDAGMIASLNAQVESLKKLHESAEAFAQTSASEKQELETIAAQLQEQVEEVTQSLPFLPPSLKFSFLPIPNYCF